MIILSSFIATNIVTFTRIGVGLGDWDLSTDPDCDEGYCADPAQHYDVQKIFIADSYLVGGFAKNDIAIIKLNATVLFTGECFLTNSNESLLNAFLLEFFSIRMDFAHLPTFWQHWCVRTRRTGRNWYKRTFFGFSTNTKNLKKNILCFQM